MELIFCIFIGIICLIDSRFERKNILGEIINVVVYLFLIMIAVTAIDFLCFGEKINAVDNEKRIINV